MLKNLYINLVNKNELCTVLYISFTEEIIFRGLIYKNFRNKLTKNKSNLLTSTIFLMFHSTINIDIMLKSLFFGYAFEKSNSLIIVGFLHILANLLIESTPSYYNYFGGNLYLDVLWFVSTGIVCFLVFSNKK